MKDEPKLVPIKNLIAPGLFAVPSFGIRCHIAPLVGDPAA